MRVIGVVNRIFRDQRPDFPSVPERCATTRFWWIFVGITDDGSKNDNYDSICW
jgi:hypothetical protein